MTRKEWNQFVFLSILAVLLLLGIILTSSGNEGTAPTPVATHTSGKR